METTKNEEIEAYIKPLKRSILLAVFILFLALLFSCEKDEDQTTMPPPEDMIEKSSSTANLIVDASQKNMDGSGCVQFQYPLSFSRYNIEFQVLDTKSILNDRQLIDFLNTLQESLLVSLNFPIELTIDNELIDITTIAELVNALTKAPQDCSTNPDCSVDNLLSSFTECPMYITSYTDTTQYNDSKIVFNFQDNTFQVFINGLMEYDGIYEFSKNTNDEFVLAIETQWGVLNGLWTILDCENFSDHKLVNQQNVTMQLQGCDYAPPTEFDCFENFRDLEICNDNLDTNQGYDLTLAHITCYSPTIYTTTYHTTEADAKENTNPISNPESFTIRRLDNTTVYFRVELINDASSYNIYTINLGFVTCEPTDCSVISTRGSLTECPIGISKYNNEIAKFEEHKLVFDSTTWELSIFVADRLITTTNYRVIKKPDGTFFLYINTRIPALMGIWLIDECGNFQSKNLTRGNDDVMSIAPACP